MTHPSRYPSRAAAFEAGRRVGAKEERVRHTTDRQRPADEDGHQPLTLAAIKAGRFSTDELIARKDEVDALLAGDQAA